MLHNAPNIYVYADIRRYLGDWLRFKQRDPRFSLRGFSKRAGFRAHNILQMVIRGDRGIALRSVPKYVKAIGLGRDEASYFEQLVILAATNNDKQRSRKMAALRKDPRQRVVLKKRQLALFRQWLAPVICEMTRLRAFTEDPHWVAERLGGNISPKEVEVALAELESYGLLQRVDGQLQPGDKSLDTGDGIVQVDLFEYHKLALAKADDALSNVTADRRNFQVLTLAITESAAGELNKLIEQFESDILRLADQPGPKTEVFQVSLQAFPVVTARQPGRRGPNAPNRV